MKIFLKKIIKHVLKFFGWKLIKIRSRAALAHPHPLPSIDHVKAIIRSQGILHLGAHRGQEAPVYDWFNKKVLWIEAIPEIFNYLNDYLLNFYNQKAICALIGNSNKLKKNFYISNSDSSCSSIFDFSSSVKEGKLWPERGFKMEKILELEMKTLDTVLQENKINIAEYDHWILDLQGAELLALQGSERSLNFCNSILIEISKKEYYEKGSATWEEIKNFMNKKNFKIIELPSSDHTEVLFIKNNIQD
jgi:FkbM family methyltransferase